LWATVPGYLLSYESTFWMCHLFCVPNFSGFCYLKKIHSIPPFSHLGGFIFFHVSVNWDAVDLREYKLHPVVSLLPLASLIAPEKLADSGQLVNLYLIPVVLEYFFYPRSCGFTEVWFRFTYTGEYHRVQNLIFNSGKLSMIFKYCLPSISLHSL
jgi:hypothetical protein